MASDTGRKSDRVIVASKGDWGIPNPTLMRQLKALSPERARKPGCGNLLALVKGQEYEFTGNPASLAERFPKGSPKSGAPRGLANLFDVKGKKEEVI